MIKLIFFHQEPPQLKLVVIFPTSNSCGKQNEDELKQTNHSHTKWSGDFLDRHNRGENWSQENRFHSVLTELCPLTNTLYGKVTCANQSVKRCYLVKCVMVTNCNECEL